ncbi:MAG: energy-coupling factor ABC transporter substrate-binding protein [Actinomycetota bacterium]
MSRRNLIALLAVVALAIIPLLLPRNSDTEFGGADGAAADEAVRIDPDLEPWFDPIWAPPGGETEGLLFALQAALGAGVLGYVAGSIRTRHRLATAGETGGDGSRPSPSQTNS